MTAVLNAPLQFVPEFWQYLLNVLSSAPGTYPNPLYNVVMGLSTNPLDFSSADNFANSIALPSYHGYANVTGLSFSGVIDEPDGSSYLSIPSQLFRQSSGGTTMGNTIAGLWLAGGNNSSWMGGCNFPGGLNIADVGDGFSVLVQLLLGSLTSQGKVVVVGPSEDVVPGGGGGGGIVPGTVQSQTFATPGTFTFTAGPNQYSVRVKLTGGSAGTSDPGGSNGAGGAGAGAWTDAIVPTVPGASYDVVVGAAGVGSAGSGGVTAGGDSTFGSGPLASAKGGSPSIDGKAGGVGGLASAGVGIIKYNGGSGGAGVTSNDGGGGGGASAGPGGPGGNGVNGGATTGGAGGIPPSGGAVGGAGGNNAAPGSRGAAPGGAPGGSGLTWNTFLNGEPGQVVLSWVA